MALAVSVSASVVTDEIVRRQVVFVGDVGVTSGQSQLHESGTGIFY